MKKVENILDEAKDIVTKRKVEILYNYLNSSAKGKTKLGRLLDLYEEIGRSKRDPDRKRKHKMEETVEDVRKDMKKLAQNLSKNYNREHFSGFVDGFSSFFDSASKLVKDGDMIGFLKRTYKMIKAFDKYFKRSKMRELAESLLDVHKYLSSHGISHLFAQVRSEENLRDDINKGFISQAEQEVQKFAKFSSYLQNTVKAFIP